MIKNILRRIWNGSDLTNVDYPIPYREDKSLTSFSHKNYSGLFFPEVPKENQLLRRFWSTLYSKEPKFDTLLDNMYLFAKAKDKNLFLRTVQQMMQLKIADDKKHLLFISTFTKNRTKAILEHLNKKLEEQGPQSLGFFKWEGNLIKFVEWVMSTESNGNIKSDAFDFAVWLGLQLDLDVAASYKTTKSRIEDTRDLDEFDAYKFLNSINELRGVKDKIKIKKSPNK